MIKNWKMLTNIGTQHANTRIELVNIRVFNEINLFSLVISVLYIIIAPLLQQFDLFSFTFLFLQISIYAFVIYLNAVNKLSISLFIYMFILPISSALSLVVFGLKASLFAFFIFDILIVLMNQIPKRRKTLGILWCFTMLLSGIWGSLYVDQVTVGVFHPIEDILLSSIFLFLLVHYFTIFYNEYVKTYTKIIKRNEELMTQNKELNDFCHIVSHDLKAPLRGINALSEMIQEDNKEVLDQDSDELLDLLKGRVGRMSDLIDGVLRYSRVGTTQEDIKDLDLNNVVSEVVDLLAPPSHITVEIASNLPIIKNQDVKIRQIFQNFISNAIKYNDKENGVVKISHRREDDFHEFCIADNGPGIPEKFHDHIFKIFKTISSNKKSKDSTGVGLTIIKKIIDLNNGKIWLESEEGKGTKFYFTLPSSMSVI